MTYRILADAVLVLHLLFIAFVVLGGFAVLRFAWMAFIHIPAAVWGVLIEFNGWGCPLTTLEVGLRHRAGDTGYSESFIEHYLLPVIYPHGLTRDTQFLLAGLVIVVNLAIYGWAIYRRRSSRLKSDQ